MRLTKKFTLAENGYYYYSTQDNEYTSPLVDKLGQLEDVEDDLGIDLITLYKALKNGAWTKFNNEISKCDECEYEMLDIYIYFYWNNGKHLVFLLSDYGKTWALTKEELE